MEHLYGKFSEEQIIETAQRMHSEVHKLLLYKDPKIFDRVFNSDEDFEIYFSNLLFRFSGLDTLLGKPETMVRLLSVLQAAYNEAFSDTFNYKIFRRAILDAHSLIKSIFEEDEICRV